MGHKSKQEWDVHHDMLIQLLDLNCCFSHSHLSGSRSGIDNIFISVGNVTIKLGVLGERLDQHVKLVVKEGNLFIYFWIGWYFCHL